MSSFDKKVCDRKKFWSSFYQNLGEPLITIAIFRFLRKQRGVLQAKNVSNCDPNNFSIVLSYSGGFAAQLHISVCHAAH